MEDYKPNSNKYKENQELVNNEKRAEKVVTGKVITKKKSKFSQFAGEIISEDAKNVKSYVFGDVLIPALKKAISDIVTDGIDIILYGESRKGSRRGISDKVSYRNYYDRDYRTETISRRLPDQYTYDDIILDSRGEAEDVLDRMYEILSTYQIVRVADLYDLVGLSRTYGTYTDNKCGWTNLDNACVIRVNKGYLIKLPKAIPID